MEASEWEIFERHQRLKSQWEGRRDKISAQLDTLLGHLDRLVKLQQAQCFDPEKVTDDVTQELEEIQQKEIVVVPRPSPSQLDEVIALIRLKVDSERRNKAQTELMGHFYDEVTNQTSVAVFHLALSDLITSVLAASNTTSSSIDSDQSSAASEAEIPREGTLQELLQSILLTNLSLHRLSVPFASILSKLPTSWGALNPDYGVYAQQDSCLTEVFSQMLSVSFVRSYQPQLELLSIKGAFDFAQVVIVRMLGLVASGNLDLTRSVIDQFIVKLSMTVTPEHSRPQERTSVVLQGEVNFSVSIPAVIESAAQQRKKVTSTAGLRDSGSGGPVLLESEIIGRAGWEVRETTSNLNFRLSYPKLHIRPDLGCHIATGTMLKLLEENGWQAVVASSSSPKLGESRSVAGTGDLQQQLKAQQDMINQQTMALDQMSQLLRALQQQFQIEKQARLALEGKVQHLLGSSDLPDSPAPLDASPSPTSRSVAVSPQVSRKNVPAAPASAPPAAAPSSPEVLSKNIVVASSAPPAAAPSSPEAPSKNIVVAPSAPPAAASSSSEVLSKSMVAPKSAPPAPTSEPSQEDEDDDDDDEDLDYLEDDQDDLEALEDSDTASVSFGDA